MTENDLPANIRKHYWNREKKQVNRPISVRIEDVAELYEINDVLKEMGALPFIDFEKFGEELKLTVFDLAKSWFVKQEGAIGQIRTNPTLASFYEDDGVDVSYAEATLKAQPKERDREYLASLAAEIAASDEDVDLLTL
ncbi:MAG: ATP-binding protein, partial [Candidatus Methanogasteraceae archaeon]